MESADDEIFKKLLKCGRYIEEWALMNLMTEYN